MIESYFEDVHGNEKKEKKNEKNDGNRKNWHEY
jgi:hypothetical protein